MVKYRRTITEKTAQTPNPRKGKKNVKEKKRKTRHPETNRKQRSLGSVARKFVKLVYAEPTGIMDLNIASDILGVKMRRICEVVNVLEGIGHVKNTPTNEVQTCREHDLAGLHTELEDLEADENKLDILIEQAKFRCNEQYEDSKHAYINHEDIMTARQLKDQTVLVIKATEETQIQIPDPVTKHKMYIRSKAEIGVHICADQEDDPEAENSQQVDHNRGEDDLEDVLEIIKGLEGDQVTENKASKELGQEAGISGVNNV